MKRGFAIVVGQSGNLKLQTKLIFFLVILEIKENMAKKGLNDKAPVRKGFH